MVLLSLTALGCSGPERPPCDDTGEIPTVCGFRNPEDLEYVAAANLVLVSNMRRDRPKADGGYLSAVEPGVWVPVTMWGGESASAIAADPKLGDPKCQAAPDPGAFYPHGLTSVQRDDRTLVYVASHAGSLGGREAVEIFELIDSGEQAQLVWLACIPSADEVQLNDLAVSHDGLLVASNFVPEPSMRHPMAAAIFKKPTGDLMTWTPQAGWTHLKNTESLMANGVAVSSDGKTLFYAEAIGGKLHRRSVDGPTAAIDIDIDGVPDNLSWTSRGTLLLAAHSSGPGLMRCFLRSGACRSSWAVYEVNPSTMAVEKVLAHSGDSIGAVATALEIEGELLLSSVFGNRIGRMPWSSAPSSPNAQ
jgi:hypothetical protein